MAKKSELGVSSSTGNKNKKTKKKSKAQPGAVAMKVKAPKLNNPFETIWSRRKFDILGKNRKGEERRVGLARSRAIDKRKKTLLKEYEQSGKASVFVDKRIGEDNEEIGEFQKALLRSQREFKLKLSKKSKYNLSDGEEDDLGLGGSFEGTDDFEDEMLPEDDDGAEPTERDSHVLKQLDSRSILNSAETDVTEGEENKPKSKKEVMEEIIFKSKLFKAQKAKDKEENEQLMEELDKNFTSLVQSEALLSLTEPSKMNALKALVNKNIPKGNSASNESSSTQKVETFMQDKPDSYDKLVKEMSLDMRARPSDRTKTPEEIAQEERERLEQLEEERRKRMLGMDDQSDEDGEDAERPSTQQVRSISGDDLGDSFSPEEEPRNRKGWVDEILARKDEEDSEEEDGDSSEESGSDEADGDEEGSDEDEIEDEKMSSLKDWEQSEDELDADLDEEEDEEEEDEDDDEEKSDDVSADRKKQVKPISRDTDETKKKITDSSEGAKVKADVKPVLNQGKGLPCLIEAPKSLEELNILFEGRSNSEIVILISRVRASNAIALAAENRKKMQVFYGVLMQYFAVLTNAKPLNFELVNMLVKPLTEMSMEIPYFAAICARQRILRTRTQFCEAIKSSEVSSWPSLKTLFLLRLWSMIFPCSDFRHPVMTPVILLMCEYLMRCPILSGRDIAVGSFLCSMVLLLTKQSRKFCPEALMFLQSLLSSAVDRKVESNNASQFYHLMEVRALRPLLCVSRVVNEIIPLNFLKLMDMPEDTSIFSSDDFRVSILANVVETLRGFVNIYGELNSFPELFSPIPGLLLEVAENEKLPDELQNKLKDIAEIIKKKTHEHQFLRKPLQMRKQKPVPIKLVNPKFEENFVKGRDYDPDKERAEMRKLKKLIKREAKGAVRELRKDNYFLFEVKEKDRELLEQEKAEKYGKARAFLQEQEHAFKSGQLGKGRKRRR
ncbi:nucleolar protein 14 isoform X2 [Punica granatum]|uniref:Nucleolar protein 14 isoform X2 n=1 Tax=Punica granatum TaxID=22663 RepID=A0A6P8CQ20_PUNGR|nr:nucleolar protein 14 isoform X2 [Punica granatum]